MNRYLLVGEKNRLKINRYTDNGVYLICEDKDEVLMPNQYVSYAMKEGDEIDVFVYFDSEDRIVASTTFPKAMLDQFGCFEVVDVTPFGAFLDWGLPKDLLVPKALQKFPFYVGMKVIVQVCLDDETGRIIGSQKYNDFLKKELSALKLKQEVTVLVRERTPLGFKVIVNNLYDGLIFHNEIFENIEVGDEKVGYIKTLRKDGKLDIVLRPIGDKSDEVAAAKIVEILSLTGGACEMNYKSTPELISDRFGLSRKAYKRALTKLIEAKKLEVNDEGMKLL
ncbi:CvfB family protein [Sulfurospirillum multivorans]|uniref:RNA-bindining protein n=2 Tax=Sulfurospirillum multivorans TaxID=66821 RepID=A0AA86AM12_SULMK|nr:S1-like domain-containing RNA-binding protein [Sulfurospirillum multivorans]AHJ12082.1 putative RNA-bindining protein [Sulfurospirillum multivorans DSM 12446]QEH05583.1 putative RNA-bindining protein [Sulfurospirillum multivorans]